LQPKEDKNINKNRLNNLSKKSGGLSDLKVELSEEVKRINYLKTITDFNNRCYRELSVTQDGVLLAISKMRIL
jgi:hypothetical protein